MTPRWLVRREQPLARPWREAEYVVVDVEATGLDLKRDAIASYGAVVIRDGRIVVSENTYGLVSAGCEMTAASTAVHTLRRVDIADAPPLIRKKTRQRSSQEASSFRTASAASTEI